MQPVSNPRSIRSGRLRRFDQRSAADRRGQTEPRTAPRMPSRSPTNSTTVSTCRDLDEEGGRDRDRDTHHRTPSRPCTRAGLGPRFRATGSGPALRDALSVALIACSIPAPSGVKPKRRPIRGSGHRAAQTPRMRTRDTTMAMTALNRQATPTEHVARTTTDPRDSP